MRKRDLDRLARDGVAFDEETHRIQQGLAAPPIVCASRATFLGGKYVGELLSRDRALDEFVALLESDKIVVGANIAFDMLCAAVAWARRGRDILPLIFDKYERGQVFDILIAQALEACAGGFLGKDPLTRLPMQDPITQRPNKYYSLAIVTYQVLGRSNAKINDGWRQSYALLEDLPISQWPPEARDYPVDDAVNTLECALAQAGHVPKVVQHRWEDVSESDDEYRARLAAAGAPVIGVPDAGLDAFGASGGMPRGPSQSGTSRCRRCTVRMTEDVPPCAVVERHRNLHALANQCYTAFALSLGAAWGFTVDQSKVDDVEDEVQKHIDEDQGRITEWGFFREDGTANKGAIARAVALAYGATGTCGACSGVGRVTSPRAPMVRCKDCKGRGVVDAAACLPCGASGKVVSQSETYKVNCKDCCATGLDLDTAPMMPRTAPSATFPRGQVGAERDDLNESDNDKLMVLADYQKAVVKTQGTYIPFLREARVACMRPDGTPIVGFDGAPVYESRPITLKPNVFLETDRTSYRDPVQQFPRDGALRGCIVARPGFVLASVDWSYGELITWSETSYELVGFSALGEALLKGTEPHKALAAEMMGTAYETLDAWFRDKSHARHKHAKDMRQAAKPGNFMFPGGGGVATFVAIQRKNGPDTPCANGPVWLDRKKGIRGYRGTRFCILMDGAESCGAVKEREWNDRPLDSPLCSGCLAAVSRLHDGWKGRWPESRPYFALVTRVRDEGQVVTPAMLDRWPWLREVYSPGQQLPPGTFLQGYSGIMRGDCGFTDGANGWFQSRLAVAGKLALRRAQRECCDRTLGSPLHGSRVVAFQHDECLAELREDRAHEAAHRLSEIMCQALREVCPMMARAVKAPPAIMRFWTKQAEPTYLCSHARGEQAHCAESRLVPWEPPS